MGKTFSFFLVLLITAGMPYSKGITNNITVNDPVTGTVLESYDPGYLGYPVLIPVQLSANFGELRSNSFHAGIDIRTGGRTGEKVIASADGYVNRILVSPGGYGRATL